MAGNETTRNAISHGMQALTDHPDQRELWCGDFETHNRTAVEEIVRWATPGHPLPPHGHRGHRAVGGQQIEAGDKVVLWYTSANRDERVFDGPVPLRRHAAPINPTQVGFGAGGPHFCLGANLARREITVMFDELRRRLPDLRITGEPAYLQSDLHQRHQAPALRLVGPSPGRATSRARRGGSAVGRAARSAWRRRTAAACPASSVSPTMTVSPS